MKWRFTVVHREDLIVEEKRIKIAVDARTMGSRPSGIGIYLYNFLKQLIKYEELELVLISDVAESEYINYFKKQGVSVITYGKHFYNSGAVYKYFRFVKKLLQVEKPDIFWEPNTVIPIDISGDYKVVITVHDMFPVEYVKYFGIVYSMYFKHSLKKTLKYADKIMYVSECTRKATHKFFPEAEKIDSCVTHIICKRPELDSVKEKVSESELMLPEEYFLYVGNMEKRKGVDLLLKAYAVYKERGGKRHLVLAGRMLEKDIEELMVSVAEKTKTVIYKDYVSNDEKLILYDKSSAFVFPSKAEGFGIPVIEAIWQLRPVIVSDLPIFDEIAGDCINRFNIECDEIQMVENLVNMLLEYNDMVDEAAYRDVVSRYQPQVLGDKVRNFIVGVRV